MVFTNESRFDSPSPLLCFYILVRLYFAICEFRLLANICRDDFSNTFTLLLSRYVAISRLDCQETTNDLIIQISVLSCLSIVFYGVYR